MNKNGQKMNEQKTEEMKMIHHAKGEAYVMGRFPFIGNRN